MAKRSKKAWVYAPKKPPKSKVPDDLKAKVEAEARDLVENVLKPRHVQPPPEAPRFNYITDIWAKWHRGYFYFGATYACPGPTAMSPSFESKFARWQYVGGNKFALAYMRHTGKWLEIYARLSLDECLELVQNDPHFIA